MQMWAQRSLPKMSRVQTTFSPFSLVGKGTCAAPLEECKSPCSTNTTSPSQDSKGPEVQPCNSTTASSMVCLCSPALGITCPPQPLGAQLQGQVHCSPCQFSESACLFPAEPQKLCTFFWWQAGKAGCIKTSGISEPFFP